MKSTSVRIIHELGAVNCDFIAISAKCNRTFKTSIGLPANFFPQSGTFPCCRPERTAGAVAMRRIRILTINYYRRRKKKGKENIADSSCPFCGHSIKEKDNEANDIAFGS